MQYYVYILQSVSAGRFYVGQTYDLDKRLQEHNGELAGYTKKEQRKPASNYTLLVKFVADNFVISGDSAATVL